MSKNPGGKWEKLETSVEGALHDGAGEIVSLAEEMGSWRGGMEEKLSHTEKYERVSEACDALEGSEMESNVEALCDLMDKLSQKGNMVLEELLALPQSLGEVTVVAQTFTPYKGKGASRATRMEEATGLIRAALEEISSVLDAAFAALEANQKARQEKGRANHAVEAAQDASDSEVESEWRDLLDEVQGAKEEVEASLGEVEQVEFPGMYG